MTTSASDEDEDLDFNRTVDFSDPKDQGMNKLVEVSEVTRSCWPPNARTWRGSNLQRSLAQVLAENYQNYDSQLTLLQVYRAELMWWDIHEQL